MPPAHLLSASRLDGPTFGIIPAQKDADAALGPVSFLCLARKIRARGHEHLPPVSGSFRVFLSLLPCRASARRRSLGAKIPRKLPAHRCFAVCAEQIWAEARRRPQGILLYSQGLERSPRPKMPAQTGRGSCSLALRRERSACRVSEGLMNPKSAHNRSHPLALALRGLLSGTLDEPKRKTELPVYFPVIPNRCAHR